MFKSQILALTVFALSALVQAQTPQPACVLACINEAPAVEDFKAICETSVATTWSCLKTKCTTTELYDAASKHMQERCKDQGVTVDMKKAVTATSTKTSSSSKETGSSSSESNDEKTNSTTTEDDSEENAASKLGSFGALAIALTVMGAMSF